MSYSNIIESKANPYQALWLAVIERAILDTFGDFVVGIGGQNKDRYNYTQLAKRESFKFLFTDRANFHFVCNMAGIDPDYVRRKLKQIYSGQLLKMIEN